MKNHNHLQTSRVDTYLRRFLAIRGDSQVPTYDDHLTLSLAMMVDEIPWSDVVPFAGGVTVAAGGGATLSKAALLQPIPTGGGGNNISVVDNIFVHGGIEFAVGALALLTGWVPVLSTQNSNVHTTDMRVLTPGTGTINQLRIPLQLFSNNVDVVATRLNTWRFIRLGESGVLAGGVPGPFIIAPGTAVIVEGLTPNTALDLEFQGRMYLEPEAPLR